MEIDESIGSSGLGARRSAVQLHPPSLRRACAAFPAHLPPHGVFDGSHSRRWKTVAPESVALASLTPSAPPQTVWLGIISLESPARYARRERRSRRRASRRSASRFRRSASARRVLVVLGILAGLLYRLPTVTAHTNSAVGERAPMTQWDRSADF